MMREYTQCSEKLGTLFSFFNILVTENQLK